MQIGKEKCRANGDSEINIGNSLRILGLDERERDSHPLAHDLVSFGAGGLDLNAR